MLRILVGHCMQRWWWKMIWAIIHMISFQMRDIDSIGCFPVSRGVQPVIIGADGFGDGKRPASWSLKLSAIETCRFQYSEICIAYREKPGVKTWCLSYLEIVRAARLLSFQNHPGLRFLQPLSQHADIWHNLLGKLICFQADFRHPVGTRDWYPRINWHPRH